MSSCMDRLSQIVGLAKSKKVTDYKKAIKLLLEFWDDNSEFALQQITEYSQKPAAEKASDSYSWNEIFTIVHELFMTEIDRISKLRGNSGSLDKERIIKLVYATSEKAKYHLKPKDVVISTLQVLQIDVCNIYHQYYGMYLGILKKCVLQERSQRIKVAHSHWTELLDTCVSLITNIVPDVNYVEVLETIELIVRYGSSLSNLLYETKKLLPIIGKILENFELYNIRSTDILFKLTYTLCHQIVVDSRFIICRFAENMPLSLISLKGPEEKYKLYLLFIQVHHPNGAIVGNNDYYAFDDEKWKAILTLLFKMILNDIKPIKLPKSFIDLSSEVFRQHICNDFPSLSQASSFHNSVYIQPSKKMRIEDQDKIVNLVNDRDPMRAWPIIQIASVLYKKYPGCLRFNEYIEFIDITVKLMHQASKNYPIMENLCELATVFIQNSQRYEEDLKIQWDKVWDAVLRYLSMSHNDIVKKGYILVQNFISHKKVSNPNSLLRLYSTNSIQWSSYSIQTLIVFCENFVLPNSIDTQDGNLAQIPSDTLKLKLLQITLNSFTKRLANFVSIEEMSKILIGLTLKSWYKKVNDKDFENKRYNFVNLDNNFYDDLKPITTEDIEQCYVSLKLKVDFAFNQKQSCSDVQPSKKDDHVDNPYLAENLDFLVNSLIQMMQINNPDHDLSLFINKTSLIAQIITDLKAMGMIQCSFDEFCLVNEFITCLNKIVEQVVNINWSKSIRHSLEVTKALISFFQAKYDVLVNEIILSLIDIPFHLKINEIPKIKINEFVEDTKLSCCKINANTVLALYCSINTGTQMSDLQYKIMSTVLKMKKYCLSDKADVICVITFLDIFASFPSSMVSEEFTEILMDFLMQLYDHWQSDDRFNCCLLKYLPNILDKIMNDKNQVHNILMIFKLFHSRFSKGAFGQLSHLTFVQSLNSIVQHKIFSNTEIEVLKHDVFIDFIKSPYYFVRLESLKYLYSIFSMKHISCKWKSDFFDKLKDVLYSMFLMQKDLSEDEKQEEKLLRSVSVAQILATIVCSESIYRSPALLLLLQIYIDKGIDENIITKVLQAINKTNLSSKSIIEENLNYLLTYWCRDSSFNMFPFALLDCQNETDFSSRYLPFVFPALIREGKIEDAKNFCNRFEVPFAQAFEDCFSKIIPWMLVEKEELLKQSKDNSGIFQGTRNLTVLVKDNLQQIIIQAVQRLHDLNNFYEIFGTTVDLPASDPPHYKSDEVEQCFVRLTKIIGSGESHHSIVYFIIARKPSVFQKVLLQLVRQIYTNQLSEHKAKALHQYVYLCSRIVQELRESYCDSVATYFIRDIGCTLLNLTNLEDKFITKLACKYLHTMLEDLLPQRSEQVGNILNQCVKTLVPLIRSPNENSPPKEVLVYLLRDNKQILAEAIKTLSSLPSFLKSNDDLDTESEFLRDNVSHFLSTSDDKNCNIDSLLNLKRQLATKTSQLEEMYEKLGSLQGFAEHCASSLLHRLIYRLIRLSESTDTKIAIEAAKCLGVLGPADLSTMILHPQESQRRETFDKADILTHNVCNLLTEFIVSSDIEVRTASSEALYAVLKSPWGIRLLSDMEFESTTHFNQLFKDFLYPFRSSHKSTSSNAASFKIDVEKFESTFDPQNPHWSKSSSGDYTSWVASITSSVANCLNGFYGTSLISLFRLSVQFCEATLPRLISLLIDTYPNLSTNICQCVNRLFNYHFNVRDVGQAVVGVAHKQLNESCDAIRCMLDVVNHLRIQSNEQVHLDFDYLPIAMAAQFSSAYFSSILYAELWCRSNLKVVRDFDSIPIIDQVYEKDNKLGKIVQDILKEAYIKIGDPDSVYGCGSSHLQNRKSRIPYYTNFQKLDKVLLSHDIELSNGNLPFRGMINALRKSSLYYLAKHFSTSTPIEVDSVDDLCYDTLWRLGDWNQISSFRMPQSTKKIHDFSVYHYEALKSLHENDKSTLQKCLEQAHLCVIKELSSISLESCKAIYPKLTQLQMLREIQEYSTTNTDDIEILLSDWKKHKYIYNNDFQYIEPILSQRAVIFEMQNFSSNNVIVKNALINTRLDTARLAQQQGSLNTAARALETLLKQTDLDEETENRILYHEARLAWVRGDEDLARFNLRSLINKDKNSIKSNLLAHALRVYGNWIAENKSENPQVIISKYYDEAVNLYKSIPNCSPDDLSDSCKARAALAQFAHEQYIMITEYLQSPQFESLRECIYHSRSVAEKKVKSADQDVERALKISSRQTQNDFNEMQNIFKDRNSFLSIAISHYLSTLQDSDEHDLLIFRLVSLWLDNMHNEELNKLFDCHLLQIPSYKFVPLVPQLAPHMSNVLDTFSQKISLVLERCAKDHPHHTLPVLLALKNLYNDSKYCEKKIMTHEPRVIGTQQLIQKLGSTHIRPIIQEMDKLSDALVQLAYFDVDKKKAMIANCPIPKKLSLHEVKNFQYSMVLTLPIDVRKDGNYSDIISTRKYEDNYSNVGGINAPKKIICIGTDGIRRPQLVKGKDDLRQDAVMQQVFTVMNSLLKTDKGAKHRKLHVRTYKIVPLTQRSGVLQWCENTLPLSNILTGDGSTRQLGLHRKYYPNDYAPTECRRRLQGAKNNAPLRLNVFRDCCENLRPAFHHFFLENYLSPETWFERRLAYTRSVATTSIIGYILGLGDRHVSNILIDKTTAEVIHIDFGIAFEQGKVLPTPETVPFRLTRDIEVAMGVSGIEGTMRRCCEETMSVLRKQREIIVTLLRVLLYDPLYSWAITPAKAATYQSENSSRLSESSSPANIETNKLAERALLRVQQKLQGIEEGVASSVSGQVERLIQQARDPSNLSKLFEGWQAYL